MDPNEEYTYLARIERWVDGDTVDLQVILREETVDFGFRIFEYRKVWKLDRFRLAGIDTPEKGRPLAKEATAFANQMAPVASGVRITSYKPLQDKYGRWLAAVSPLPIVLTPDGHDVSVNQALLDAHLAVPYDGGHKPE